MDLSLSIKRPCTQASYFNRGRRAPWVGLISAVLVALTAGPAFADEARIDGVLKVSRQAALRARIEGRLQQFWVHPGDKVRKGQTLARVSSGALDENVRIAEGRDFQNGAIATSRRQAALAALDRASAQRANCQEVLARARASKVNGAIITATRNLDAASRDEAAKRRDVLANDRALDQAALQAGGRRARDRARELEELDAPFDAVVMSLGATPGAQVGPAGPVVVTVAQVDALALEAPAPSASFRFVPDQGAATVLVDELPGQKFSAAISSVVATYSPPDSLLMVTLLVANPKGLLQPGMHAHATLPLSALPARPGD
jgi:multidrug efflux pump subunit AcrA (membrane-fusion protein)